MSGGGGDLLVHLSGWFYRPRLFRSNSSFSCSPGTAQSSSSDVCADPAWQAPFRLWEPLVCPVKWVRHLMPQLLRKAALHVPLDRTLRLLLPLRAFRVHRV